MAPLSYYLTSLSATHEHFLVQFAVQGIEKIVQSYTNQIHFAQNFAFPAVATDRLDRRNTVNSSRVADYIDHNCKSVVEFAAFVAFVAFAAYVVHLVLDFVESEALSLYIISWISRRIGL